MVLGNRQSLSLSGRSAPRFASGLRDSSVSPRWSVSACARDWAERAGRQPHARKVRKCACLAGMGQRGVPALFPCHPPQRGFDIAADYRGRGNRQAGVCVGAGGRRSRRKFVGNAMLRSVPVFTVLFTAALAAGCNSGTADRAADSTTVATDDDLRDYSTWPAVTPKAILISKWIFQQCPSVPPVHQVPEVQKEWQRRGPHFRPAIKVYANPVGHEALQSDSTSPMPVGSVVIKEKWWNEDDPNPIGYAAMIKRESGYDSDHGDWEYAFVERQDANGKLMTKPNVSRG